MPTADGTASDALAARLARALPDAPRFVEPCAMLRSGHATVLGGSTIEEGFVVRVVHGAISALAAIGRPPASAIVSAIDGTTDMTPILAQVDNAEYIDGALKNAPRASGGQAWRGERVILHRLAAEPPLRPLDPGASLRLATKQDPLDHLPPGLRFEIRHALDLAPVGAAFVDGRAASFCYPCWATDSMWDVSIDTVPGLRGRGLAAHAVRFMIERLRPSGRAPLWSALESNSESRRLAARLGFAPADEIVAFSRGPWAFLTNGYTD
jgi:GNAT superfamily N-acetyltransferase